MSTPPKMPLPLKRSSRRGNLLRSGRSGNAARVAIKSGVNAILGDEIRTGTILHDPAVLHHNDAVEMMNRAEAVRDDECRFPPH